MRKLLIVLALALLIACGSGLKTSQIDWANGSIDSQIHGVIDGDAAQDAATYGQVNDRTKSVYVTCGDGPNYDFQPDEVQEAVNWAGTYQHDGGTVLFGPGNFSVDNLVVPFWVTLRGYSHPVYLSSNTIYPNQTVFICESLTNHAINPGRGDIFENIVFYYPGQSTGDNEAPIPYPATFGIEQYRGDYVTIRDCQAINPYIFVEATEPHWHLDIQDTYASPYLYGVIEDNCTDGSRFDNFRISTAYSGTGYIWKANNGIALYIKRSDGVTIHECTSYGYQKGIVLETTAGARVSNCHIEDFIGIYANTASDCNIENNFIYTTDGIDASWDTAQYGINCLSSNGLLITGNNIISGGTGIYMNGGYYNHVVANEVDFNPQNSSGGLFGIADAWTTSTSYVGNNVQAWYKSDGTTGIYITADSTNPSVSVNVVRGCLYGIYSAANGNAIGGNTLRACTNNIADAGTGGSVVANMNMTA